MTAKLVAVLFGVAVLAGCGADGGSGIVPTGAPPPGGEPSGVAAPGVVPSGAVPAGAVPSGVVPPRDVRLPGAVPPGVVPPGVVPSPREEPPRDVPASMLVSPGERSGGLESLTLPTGAKFRVVTNFPMAGARDVTRAVIVVHGDGRTARGDFDRMLAAARAAGVDSQAIIVAPWFAGEQLGPEEIAWSDQAWKQGDGSEQGDLSSFVVMDQLIASLASRERFPAMRHITLAGHSAGGQFAQRYAAFGRAPELAPWVEFNFVVMNPSSYVYFGPERPTADGTRFAVPPAEGCPGFNDYKYGLEHRQGYVARLTPEQARARYLGRRVTILNGALDTLANHNLDTTCQANLEGPSRLARGTYYHNYLPGQDYVVIPGVGHDTGRMFASRASWPSLFGVTNR